MAAGLGATIFWQQRTIRPAMQMTFYFFFFLANTAVFYTRPVAASFSSGTEFWIAFICAATKGCSTWGAAEAQY